MTILIMVTITIIIGDEIDVDIDEDEDPPEVEDELAPEIEDEYKDVDEAGPSASVDPYPGLAKKREIINYWVLGTKSRRSFPSMKSRYPRISSDRQLRKWKTQLDSKGKYLIDQMFI